EGLCGNEDCGQMSAWFIFSALGFYPVNPAEGTYVLGVPLFNKAQIELPNGRKFSIIAKNYSANNRFVDHVLLNDKPLSRTFLTHEQIMDGGTLEFVMTDKPGSKWGTEPEDAPPSESPS
ncbi:MAG TPA: glycoside hydrolase domain-containing protein, partial [Chroococcales cyanobacterium]